MKMILFCEKMVIIGPRNNFVLFFAFLVERFNVIIPPFSLQFCLKLFMILFFDFFFGYSFTVLFKENHVFLYY
jgi:hypothetical protein